MRKVLLVFIFIMCPFSLFSQTIESASKKMNDGQYDIAKIYWEALNADTGLYTNKIAICNICIKLQAEAKDLIATERYTKAIEKYQAILAKNPSDHNAVAQIKKCEKLREIYIEAHSLRSYSNPSYVYTYKFPAFMSKSSGSTNENIVFGSSDANVHVNITSTIYKSPQSNTQILNKVIESFAGGEITYKVIKDDWVVVSGYQPDGRIFYNKSIIALRKSQYNETVKILVSALAICPKGDDRINFIADCIHKNLKVDTTGPHINVLETDDERWQRAKKTDTKEAYSNYLTYAPYNSPHKEEAKGRRSLCEAREQYKKASQTYSQSMSRTYYENAKKLFESGDEYMTTSDKEMYRESYYQYILNPNRSPHEIRRFMTSYPWHPKIKVVRGCLVKAYCSMGLYSSAKDYIKVSSNYPIWFSENTSYTQKQWLAYIKTQKNKKTSSGTSYNKSTSKYNSVGNPVGKYKKGSSLGYTFGVGTEVSFPKLYVGAFPQIKVIGGLGDNFNRINLLVDLTIGYSGDWGTTFKAKLAPRWNIVADEFYLYAQPEVGYDFFQGGGVYGGRIGVGLDYLGSISLGYIHSSGFGGNLWQLSYVYNWYW